MASDAPHPATIRPAADGDWPGIWAALEPVFRAGETYTSPRDISEADAREAWTSAPGARVLVAVDETGAVLATAKYLPNLPGAGSHVANASFVVGQAARGRRLGERMGRAVLDAARADGFRAMQFNAVVTSNLRAVRLWQELGFEILATVPEAFDHPVDGLVGLHIMFRTL
jgi:L-amino acid N-acyltransferase YncA